MSVCLSVVNWSVYSTPASSRQKCRAGPRDRDWSLPRWMATWFCLPSTNKNKAFLTLFHFSLVPPPCLTLAQSSVLGANQPHLAVPAPLTEKVASLVKLCWGRHHITLTLSQPHFSEFPLAGSPHYRCPGAQPPQDLQVVSRGQKNISTV